MILNNELIYNNLKKHNNKLFENLEKISELINIDKLTISNIGYGNNFIEINSIEDYSKINYDNIEIYLDSEISNKLLSKNSIKLNFNIYINKYGINFSYNGVKNINYNGIKYGELILNYISDSNILFDINNDEVSEINENDNIFDHKLLKNSNNTYYKGFFKIKNIKNFLIRNEKILKVVKNTLNPFSNYNIETGLYLNKYSLYYIGNDILLFYSSDQNTEILLINYSNIKINIFKNSNYLLLKNFDLPYSGRYRKIIYSSILNKSIEYDYKNYDIFKNLIIENSKSIENFFNGIKIETLFFDNNKDLLKENNISVDDIVEIFGKYEKEKLKNNILFLNKSITNYNINYERILKEIDKNKKEFNIIKTTISDNAKDLNQNANNLLISDLNIIENNIKEINCKLNYLKVIQKSIKDKEKEIQIIKENYKYENSYIIYDNINYLNNLLKKISLLKNYNNSKILISLYNQILKNKNILEKFIVK